MLVTVAQAGTVGMGSAVLVVIVDVEVAASGFEPRASVVVRDLCLSCLDLPSFLKIRFISLNSARCAAIKVGDERDGIDYISTVCYFLCHDWPLLFFVTSLS